MGCEVKAYYITAIIPVPEFAGFVRDWVSCVVYVRPCIKDRSKEGNYVIAVLLVEPFNTPIVYCLSHEYSSHP